MKKVAIGMPHFASKHLSHLLLCIKSLQRYTTFDYELFILLNCSDPEQYKQFSFPTVLEAAGEVHVKYYQGNDNDYKQTLIDWIADSKFDFTHMIILHSDVFLYRDGVLERMLAAIEGTDHIASYWEVPTQFFQSTYHLSEESLLRFIVCPRITTWIMCIAVDKYRSFRDKCPLGRKLFIGYEKRTGDPELDKVWDWFSENCPSSLKDYYSAGEAIIDHGGILRYYIDKGDISGVSLGEDVNPSFDSMDLFYTPYGYVHIGQSDPNRYNDIFYSKKLLDLRMKEIQSILENEYSFVQ